VLGARRLDVDVDPVQQRAGDALLRVAHHRRGEGALIDLGAKRDGIALAVPIMLQEGTRYERL
jgi:hypothetical protein